jgi:signal transduction histidine kinase
LSIPCEDLDMSCVMPNSNALESGASVADAESYAWFCRELDEGLHALAQPLTILRGALGALTMRGAVRPETASRYLEMSSTQVDRLCNLLSGLHSLLDGVRSEPACMEIEFPLLDEEERKTEMANRHTPVHES